MGVKRAWKSTDNASVHYSGRGFGSIYFQQADKEMYALGISPDSLPHLLREIAGYYQCRSMGIDIVDKNDLHVACEAVPDISDDELQRYAQHFGRLKPILQGAQPGAVCQRFGGTQLSIFQKTETRRQALLVGMLRSMPIASLQRWRVPLR